MLYPLSSNSWNKEEAAVFQRVLEKGRFTMGDSVKEFETDFAKKFKVSNALMVSSGSMANLIALAAFFYKKKTSIATGRRSYRALYFMGYDVLPTSTIWSKVKVFGCRARYFKH